MCQAIMFLHNGEDGLCTGGSQFPFQPMFQMCGHSFERYLIQIPCHIHEQFYLILGRLDVADVQYPHFLYSLIVSLLHLLINERWTHGAQP